MKKEKYNPGEKVKSILYRHAQGVRESGKNGQQAEFVFSDDDISLLINELQLFQLELEMQNDELMASYTTLDAEREKFAGLFNLAPVGYFILDFLGMIEEVNQTGIDLLGYPKSSLYRKRFQSFIAPDSLESFYSFLHKMQNSNTKKSLEVKLVINNEQAIYTRMEGIVIPSMITSEIKYYITVIDITESRNAQQLLKETKERLEMTLRASSTGIWSVEFGNNMISFDDFSYDILKLNPLDFDGTLQAFFQLIHQDDRDMVKRSFSSGINNTAEVDLEFRVLTPAGVKYLAAKGLEISATEDHRYFAGILMDVSERKRLARETEMLKLDQQKNIMSATLNAQEKERSSISRALHDSVCQILYGIRLNLESIQLSKNIKFDFKNINQLLDQAIRETRQLSYELTPSVLKDFGFTAGVKEMAQRSSTPQFLIKTHIDPTVDQLHAKVQLYAFRIIQELVNNSIKHAHATEAIITVRYQNDMVVVQVSDNGRGFKTDIEKAYLLGSGLRGIKNQLFLLNGNIDFNSTEMGTTVAISFNRDVDVSERDT